MTGRIILHIDMDSFYASIEVRNDPNLIGKPVVVGSDPKGGTGRGVISTCSYEARAYGLHSGMPISRAWQLCPDAIYLPVNRSEYLSVSERIMKILTEYSDIIEQVSIDEAYLDITECQSYEKARIVAEAIKEEIKKREKLGCSIGIAPGRSYAKIASDLQKPDGLVIIPPEDLASFLEKLPISVIPGIGKRTSAHLALMNLHTVGELGRMDIQHLQDIFGSWAVRVREIATGRDRSGLREHAPCQSISREITFSSDTEDQDLISAAIDEMALSVVEDLKTKRIRCRTIGIKIRYTGFVTQNRSRTQNHPIDDLLTIRQISCQIFQELYTGDSIRLIGIRLSGLVHENPVQRSLSDFFSL